MCGLFGVVGPWALDLQAAEAALRSRGPDDSGRFEGEGCRLLHTRLAIQDLSPLGHQPMRSGDGRLVLVFNGEIYTAPQLRGRLEAAGCRFDSRSDTEVILQGFAQWGERVWAELDGIFACALWDADQRRLSLARDRFGIKPLYLQQRPGALAFASELSALRAAGATAVDREALPAYALWGAFAGEQTPLQGVSRLPAGAVAQWSAAGGLELLERPSPSAPALVEAPSSLEQAVLGVRERLQAAVAAQMIGDVPVGCFLSGGLDSGVLAALLQDCSTEPVTSLCVGVDAAAGLEDEAERAQATADHLGTHHHTIRLEAAAMDGLFEEFLEAIDAPSIDGFNTFLVARAARQIGLKVAFSGLGADEVFAGYPQFGQWQRSLEAAQPPSPLGRLPVQLLRLGGQQGLAYASRGLGAALDLRQIPFHGLPAARRHQLRAQRLGLLGAEADGDLPALSRLELAGYLRDTLLRDTDAVSMHNALEVRVPYLDAALVRYSQQLPGAWQLAHGPKTLLRRAWGHRLPPQVLQAAKSGFNLALGPWLLSCSRFAPGRISAQLKPWGVPRRAVLASWAYLRWRPERWQPYWRWVVLAEWLRGATA
ncbi:MAG: asparagine synthase (glutamine-hydrolyzing) [Vulcanococcus sp.]